MRGVYRIYNKPGDKDCEAVRAEAAKGTAISMRLAAGLPVAEANLYNRLSILEDDMAGMFG